MANEMTIKREVLYLGYTQNSLEGKKGEQINYITVDLIDRLSKCKINCSLKCKVEDFVKLNLVEYELYIADLQFTFADKIKCKCLELKDIK